VPSASRRAFRAASSRAPLTPRAAPRAQTLVGVLLLGLGGSVQALLDGVGGDGGDGGGAPRVRPLTALFFALYLLMATQDVAVDGWALTLLSRRNVGLASPVNAVGQTLGFFAAFTGYLALAEHGLATLPGFMRFCGALFLASAGAVWATRAAP
jgi:PAT family acetyl-CoA transporter-like MFS transporter 1